MSELTAEQKRRIANFAQLCFNALVRADGYVVCDHSTAGDDAHRAAADAHRALAAYWSGRAFGEVLA